MTIKSQTQPVDPNNASAESHPQLKECNSCFAIQPLAAYSVNRMSKDLHDPTCKECRAQRFRLQRKAKYNSVSKIDDSIVRNIHIHNTSVLDLALSLPEFKCVGFIPSTNKVFRIFFGRSRYDLPSMAMFNEDMSTYREIAYSGIPTQAVKDELLAFLKVCKIRLELSDLHMMASKNSIYFIGPISK